MAKPVRPRFGSMGVWPRVRAKSTVAKVRSIPNINEPILLGFPAYKAGMTHLSILCSDKNKRAANIETFTPATILECPAVKIASVRFYDDNKVAKQLNFKFDKELLRKIPKNNKVSTKEDLEKTDLSGITDVKIQVYTQPKLISLKKTPELFEISLGGALQDKLEFIKKHLDQPITIKDVFKEGELVDSHAVTKGKGFQGAVKRFGIGLKSHKSEKARRTPGSLGGWVGQAHIMYRVAHAGQMGYHQRTQFNNLLLKIGNDPKEINPKGGLINYGEVKGDYVLIKGSLQGAKKRLVLLTKPVRVHKTPIYNVENIKYVNQESQQGR